MRTMAVFLCLLLLTLMVPSGGLNTDATAMRNFLADYNTKAATAYNKAVHISWNYYTNITNDNQQKLTESDLEMANFTKEMAAQASQFDFTNNNDLNSTEKRQFKKITEIGFAAVNDSNKIEQKSRLESELTSIYSTGKVCLDGKGCLQLEPGLTDILTNSRNPTELLAVWKGWRDQTGKKMRQKYTEFVNVMNEMIRFSGYNDTGEYWRSWYEADTFEADVRKLYDEFRPLYQQLHAYVRQKLKTRYGEYIFPSTGHIPAHLFGNMWSQSWSNIYDLLTPYPDATSVDITQKMKDLGYNVTYMYQVAEDFFMSIGLDEMPESFWNKSMLVKPEDREVVCHASAWDFYDGKDVRIKMCTTITKDHWNTVHHELGHVHYFMAYDDKPNLFRGGANPGFHEGMADIVSLSFQTPEHMHAIGLLDTVPDDTESDINFLMQMALDKIAFLPFGYLIDQWRWSVFRGDTTPNNYTASWWNLRCGYQGISPPVVRTEEDFDPGAKYHIPGNTPYIRYFVSFVIQFQWHKALCDEIGYTGPLHRCDIYKNKTAGAKLRKMLELGSSKPWQDAMEVMTGSRSMSALPLVEYFKPLIDWLKIQNNGQTIGWDSSCPTEIPSPTDTGVHITMSPWNVLFFSILVLVLTVIRW